MPASRMPPITRRRTAGQAEEPRRCNSGVVCRSFIGPRFRLGRVSRELSGAVNEDGPEIIDVGIGRTRRQKIAEATKEFGGGVIVKKDGRIEAKPPRPGQRGGINDRSGGVIS